MLIRSYEENDEAAVVSLWRECSLLRPWNDPHRDIARKLAVQRELFLVGEIDRAIIATVMAGYEGHRGWVNYLAVAPEQRRQGYGARLIGHVEQRLLEAGCPKLNLQIRASNIEAVSFYQRLGFRVDDVVSFGKRLIPD